LAVLFVNLNQMIMKKTLTLLLTLFLGTFLLSAQVPPYLEKVTEGEVDYWVLYTPADLLWLASIDTTLLDANSDGTPDFENIDAKLGANYRLGADIVFDADPSTVDWNNDGVLGDPDDALGMYAIAPGQFSMPNFTGHFDGQYYAIENIYMNNPASVRQRVALFGNISGATIENLYVKNFQGTNNEDYGGIIVARAEYGGPNVLRRIYVDGNYDWTPRTSTTCHFGGMVGRAADTEITECVSMVTVVADPNSHNRIGGLVGTVMANLTLKDSYAVSTSFTAKEKVGLVVGFIDTEAGVAIENCYAAGKVTGGDPVDSEVGSFAGNLKTIVPVSSYWDVDLDTTGVGPESDSAAIAAVTGLATADFATEANFVGWDFTDTWAIGMVDGVMRPYLKWQDIPAGGPISVKERANMSMVKVYPNPATSNLTIENAPVNAEYRLINMIGQTLESGIITGSHTMLNIEKYQKGIYLLKVGDDVSKIMVK
jgi:hypothetical protein